MTCTDWKDPQHLLFQLANCCFLVSCLAPDNSVGILVMHASLALGGLVYSTWTWNFSCAPDVFSWTFSLPFLSIVQVLYDLYRLRPVRLESEVESAYAKLFQPLGVIIIPSFVPHTFKW